MDTYTITFTNGNTTTFTVTNGNDGEKGDKGDKGDKGNTGNTGATGNGISTVAKTGTSGLVDTYTITFTNGNTTTFTVTNGADGTVPIVTSWESTLSDSKVPSEKLTKNALDGKLDNTIGSSAVTIASNDNIVITDTSDSNKVKKVANLLASQVKDSTAHSNIGSSANDTQATINSDIDTALSNKVSKSSTSGLLKNDGTVDTSSYITSSALSNYVQKSNTTGLLKNDGTVDTTSYSTFSGSYNDLSNKPTIPTKISDLTNDSDFIEKSNTNGLVKNDGTIDTSTYLTSSALSNYVQKSSTNGLLKNDGTVDTTSYSTFSGSYNDLSNKPTIPSASSTTPSADTTNGSYGSGTSYARSNHSHPKSSLYA